MRPRSLVVLLALGGIAAAAYTVVQRADVRRAAASPEPAAAGWNGLVGSPRAQVAVGQRVLVVLRAPSLATQVLRAGGYATEAEERRWTATALASQQQILADLALKGVAVRPEFRYTRLINGFSAAIDPRAVPVLERVPEVQGVYPVRVAYPAAVSRGILPGRLFARGLGHRPDVSLTGFDGSGVEIALLDTGVDGSSPFLHGHVRDGLDLVDGRPNAGPRASPADPNEVERHGTEMAGLLVGAGGPGGLSGIAAGSTLLPIRVAGWQRDASGAYAVYARTDQILAGLERAVDPNGDGDAHDAVRIALVPLALPFGSFADDPLARAVTGAMRLDTLVVAPAGNDGPAGPSFGSVSGPGGAPAALTVGAADLRAQAERVTLVARSGLHTYLSRELPLAGAFGPRRRLTLELAAPRAGKLFVDGLSLVAARAALVRAGSSPSRAAEAASRAGASLVLLYGEGLPPGALGLDESVAVPVVALPTAPARRLAAALERGERVQIAVGPSRVSANAGAQRLAPFSSWGFSFDARLKPELVAPGVGLTTVEPGAGEGGDSVFGTVSGSSAAAAVVTGLAARLAQARPSLGAGELKSVLVGTARPLDREPLAGQGAGLADAGAASAAELAVEPATLAFGRARGDGWHLTRSLAVRNVSSRKLIVYVATNQAAQPRVALRPSRTRLVIAPGRSVRLDVTARVGGRAVGASAGGVLTLTPLGGVAARVPWTALTGPAPPGLVGSVKLSATRFAPSETTPTVLAFRAGRVLRFEGGASIQPVLRLDLELRDAAGKSLGLLSRLRDLLPGRYAFGVTGRNSHGGVLKPGSYRLRLSAWPTTPGAPTVVSIAFEIVKGKSG